MKKFILAFMMSTGMMSQLAGAAPVSSSGWFYTAVSYSGGEPSFHHVGAFSSEEDCNVARNNDYGDGGAIPWDGGPGCFYLYESDIPSYNELLEHWNMSAGDNTGLPNVGVDFQELLDAVTVLIEEHAIIRYRASMDKLTTSKER